MIIKDRILLLLIAIFLSAGGCAKEDEHVRLKAPEKLPYTEDAMKSPDFWISRNPFPDKVILDAAGIEKLNKKTGKDLKLIKDVTAVGPVYSASMLDYRLSEDMLGILEEPVYSAGGSVAGREFFAKMKRLMGYGRRHGNIEVRYGFIIRHTNQRILPTDEFFSEEKGDTVFDELQNTMLDVGTPLAILAETTDGKWVYCDGPSSRGWVKKEDVVFSSGEDVKKYIDAKEFIVVTAKLAEIFLDPKCEKFYDRCRMGATFPLAGRSDTSVNIIIPSRTKDGKFSLVSAYVKREDVSVGYLPYTPRNILEEAFKFLNAKYSWGSSPGEPDCSSFIQSIFATVGIKMPRNAAEERFVGKPIGEFEKEGDPEARMNILKKHATGGVTIIWLKGHIMLFLGMYNDRPYVIHATYSYLEEAPGVLRRMVIDKVLVSDLSLGEKSPKGTLISRILSIRIVE